MNSILMVLGGTGIGLAAVGAVIWWFEVPNILRRIAIALEQIAATKEKEAKQ